MVTLVGTSMVSKQLSSGDFQPGVWEELTALLVSEDLGKAVTHTCAHAHTHVYSQRQQTVEVAVTMVSGGL